MYGNSDQSQIATDLAQSLADGTKGTLLGMPIFIAKNKEGTKLLMRFSAW